MPEVFIVNPAAHNYSADLENRIARQFPAATVLRTKRPGEASTLALQALDQGAQVIVACGGDGTFREVASAVRGACPLGFVPMGTVNLVARQLGLPKDPEASLGLLRSGKPTSIYGGQCYADKEPGRLFFIGVSVGPDADAVHAVGGFAKAYLGPYAYGFRFAERMMAPVEPNVRYELNGEGGWCGEFLALRSPEYGGPYRIAEHVSLFQPGIETIAARRGRLGVLRLFWGAFRGRIGSHACISRAVTLEATIELPSHGRFQVDGDAFTAKSLRLVAETEPLTVLTLEG